MLGERLTTLLSLISQDEYKTVDEFAQKMSLSTKTVRGLLQEGRVQETQPLLPATTYEYCEHHFGGNADRA